MAVAVIMPRQGQSVESCVITSWNKKVGDAVKVGDVLFSYETDKSSFDEEAKVEGTLIAAFFEEGDDIPCLTNVCVIGNPGEDFSAFDPKGGSSAPAEAPAPAPVSAPAAAPAMSVAAKKASAKEGVTPVLMPRQGQSVESCVITSWAKKVGDAVKVGDVIFSYETDKSSFDEEAKAEGVMQGIFFEEGDDVPCLTVVCCIGKAGVDVSDFDPKNQGAAPAVAETTTVAAAPVAEIKGVAAEKIGDKLKISPRAKNLADKLGIDASLASATGPYGRIIEKDINTLADNYAEISAKVAKPDLATVPVEAKVAAPASEAVADYKDEPLSNIRKTISKAMTASLTQMAQLTLNSSFDATAVMNFRKKIKAAAEMGVGKITVTDIIIYAVSRTLKNHPYVNANLLDGKTMRFFNVANVGLAVDTPRGLLVPTIFKADQLSLSEISKKAKEGADKCKEGKISPDELKGASFTISNLGTFGVETFTPVINPPQTCILGVNTIQQKIKIVDGEMKPYPAMGLSLTFDHRALDGAPAARFLKDLVYNLENIEVLLIK